MPYSAMTGANSPKQGLPDAIPTNAFFLWPNQRIKRGHPLKWARSIKWVSPPGEVVEWLMALVLKTSEVRASVGSNPTLSVH